jgi:hypothetical protein
MRLAIFLAILFAASVSAIASATSILSPDHHQTFAYGEMLSHQLYLERASGSSTGLIWRRAQKSICIKRAGA